MDKSPIDSIIIDLILDHYNTCRMTGQSATLSEADFDAICKSAEHIWFSQIMITETGGSA